jgi:hypothetical protein
MRNLLFFIIACAVTLAGCGSSEPQTSSVPQAMPTATVRTPAQSAQTEGPNSTSIAHGAPPSTGAPALGTQTGADTTALDKKVEQAEAKAKGAGATGADKQAAAAAYLERGNFFYNAGNPTLYKFALRDFRRTLRYDPDNEEALAKQQELIRIYRSLNRPVPELGNEP